MRWLIGVNRGMLYARIDLALTNYNELDNWRYITDPDIQELNNIYQTYCRFKKFKSVMPIFNSEYSDSKNDIIGYYDDDKLVAFSLLRRYDTVNVEAIQFAWTYHKPDLFLGLRSLEHECAIYKQRGFQYLYLGEANEYKRHFTGFEILGNV
jgi:hypothetical protein